jgi:NADPH:quinone reductase-like Zn-dependent oxidoreductase
MPLQALVDQVAAGRLPIQLGPVFQLDQLPRAHALMEQTSTRGKVVVLT